jgi:hypothetical protein
VSTKKKKTVPSSSSSSSLRHPFSQSLQHTAMNNHTENTQTHIHSLNSTQGKGNDGLTQEPATTQIESKDEVVIP